MSRLPELPLQLATQQARSRGSSALYRAGTIAGSVDGCAGYLIAELYDTQIAPVDNRQRAVEPWPVIAFALSNAIEDVEMADCDVDTAMSRALGKTTKDGIGFHPGAQEFLRHALTTYLEYSIERAGDGLTLGSRPEIEAGNLTLRAWGLHYANDDRSVREVRRLRYGPPRTDEKAMVWAAVAAKVGADGVLPERAEADPEPAVVRVVEVSIVDGASAVLLDTDAMGARGAYNTHARPRVDALQDATTLRPGYACATCRWVQTCPAVPVARGVLGSPRPAVLARRWNPLGRSVSATDLDVYARCSALYHLARDLHLPRAVSESKASRRGLSVHRWLRSAHERVPARACTPADLPADGPDPLGVLHEEEYATAWPFLRHHSAHCPLGFDELDELEVEQRYAVFDPDADTLVVATPDLSFRLSGSRVWRETKSTVRGLPGDAYEVLETFSQACLDLALLARGADDGAAGSAGVLEFEVLGVDESVVYYLSADDRALVARAEQLVAAMAHEWSQDTTFVAQPSELCRYCEVRRWCPNRDDPPVQRRFSARDLESSWYDSIDEEVGF